MKNLSGEINHLEIEFFSRTLTVASSFVGHSEAPFNKFHMEEVPPFGLAINEIFQT